MYKRVLFSCREQISDAFLTRGKKILREESGRSPPQDRTRGDELDMSDVHYSCEWKYNRANYFIQLYANLKKEHTISYLSSNHWHCNRIEKGNSFSKGLLGYGLYWDYLEAISTERESWRVRGERSLWSVPQETEVSGVLWRLDWGRKQVVKMWEGHRNPACFNPWNARWTGEAWRHRRGWDWRILYRDCCYPVLEKWSKLMLGSHLLLTLGVYGSLLWARRGLTNHGKYSIPIPK